MSEQRRPGDEMMTRRTDGLDCASIDTIGQSSADVTFVHARNARPSESRTRSTLRMSRVSTPNLTSKLVNCAALKRTSRHAPTAARSIKTMASIEITKGVTFDTVAREWRCKWSEDADKASLAAAQKVLDKHLPAMKAKGKVQRTVCGGCLDFKANTSMSADAFGAWEAEGFAPEKQFLEELAAIPGISSIETQTFTLMSM